jgi:predicted ATPase/DNA-binding CsgD family transcriptional regulator
MLNTLPAALTSILGRESETATLRQLLSRAVRLITITGPGGVGKTSLALHVARLMQDTFAEGVFFISLAPIGDPTLIVPTIAHALSLPESPDRLLLVSLKEYLRDRHVLLLLDNFEQIVTAAPLLTELLSACGRLQLMVTSREALRVRGEQEFVLSPLGLPDQPAFENLIRYPGIALFVERAQAAQLEFRLTPQNAAAVTEICSHLDGLPLALELAAARIKLLPPQAMLAQLRDSPLSLLAGGARDLPARQQTLRSAVKWSYDLLDAEEQRAFRWFSAFAGGSTLEAALAVIGPPASVDIFDSLVNKSLLRAVETNGAARLVMLGTIREFGWEQLALTDERQAARRAHAGYYLSFAEDAEQKLAGADQKDWFQRLEREQNNLRAALQWAIEQRECELAERLAGALQPFWFGRGYWSEGRRWLEVVLAMDSGTSPYPKTRAKALYGAGVLARFQGDFARARSLCEQSLALYRTLADQAGMVLALVQLGRICVFQDDQTAARAFLAEAAASIDGLPDTVAKANAYIDIILAKIEPGDSQYPPEASRYIDESERIQRALNNPAGLAFALTHQGNRALMEGDDPRAASRFDEAERLVRELGDDRLLSRIALSRVPLDIRAGDFAAARCRLEDSIHQAGSRGDHHLPSTLAMLAVILQKQGLANWSARVFGMVEARSKTSQSLTEINGLQQRIGIEDIRAELRAQLGHDAFAREIAAGYGLSIEDLRAIPYPQGPSLTRAAPPSAPGASLTGREIEVLRLLDQDLSNPQIAERLVVSRRTVDAHLRSIYDKLGVKSRDAAIRVASERGLVSNKIASADNR